MPSPHYGDFLMSRSFQIHQSVNRGYHLFHNQKLKPGSKECAQIIMNNRLGCSCSLICSKYCECQSSYVLNENNKLIITEESFSIRSTSPHIKEKLTSTFCQNGHAGRTGYGQKGLFKGVMVL
jgi:hypothetical protein